MMKRGDGKFELVGELQWDVVKKYELLLGINMVNNVP